MCLPMDTGKVPDEAVSPSPGQKGNTVGSLAVAIEEAGWVQSAGNIGRGQSFLQYVVAKSVSGMSALGTLTNERVVTVGFDLGAT